MDGHHRVLSEVASCISVFLVPDVAWQPEGPPWHVIHSPGLFPLMTLQRGLWSMEKIPALTIHKLALVETMFSSGYIPWVTIRSGTPPCPWHGVHHGRPPGRQSSFWNHPGHGCIHQVLELHPLWCEVAVAFFSESAAPGVLPNYQLLPTTRRYYSYWTTYDLEACLVRRPISATICVIYHAPPPCLSSTTWTIAVASRPSAHGTRGIQRMPRSWQATGCPQPQLRHWLRHWTVGWDACK